MSKFKKICSLINIFNPKYTNMIWRNLELFLYNHLGKNNKNTYDKLNKKYCKSYFKYFKKLSYSTSLRTDGITKLSKVIFVFWYDGAETMPKLVKLCYENLLKTTKYPVILLDKNNLEKYSNISPTIYKLLEDKKISLTLFSDLLRLNLLSIHDAIWLDSTCFLYKDFPNNIFDKEFVTIYPKKGESIFDNIPKFYYAPDLHFQQSYFLAGKNKNIFTNVYNLLCLYLTNETKVLYAYRPYYITYFTFEYLYYTNSDIKKIADKRTVNNRFVERIEGHLDAIYAENEFSSYFDDSTYLYKLSYKADFKTRINNQLTPFGKLLQLKGLDFNG